LRALKLFVLLALLAPAPLARADQVPRLDVARSCRDAKDFGVTDPPQTFKNCMLDEQEAKGQLIQQWSQFKPAERRSCIPDAPSPSYVEMLTCLEMNQQILTPYNQGDVAPVPYGAVPHDSPLARPAPSPGPRGMRGL
jgi:hypothetical protein